MNNYKQDLEYAFSENKHNFWQNMYEQYFDGYASMSETVTNPIHRSKGISRIIKLEDGSKIFMLERIRRGNWNDMLLEFESSPGKKGWMEQDLKCDFVSYGFNERNFCYIMRWDELKEAWNRYGVEWKNLIGHVGAKNVGYITKSVPVPFRELESCIESLKIVKLRKKTSKNLF